MHYKYNAFSVNGQPTILAKDETVAYQSIGMGSGFTKIDIAKLNVLYECGKILECANIFLIKPHNIFVISHGV